VPQKWLEAWQVFKVVKTNGFEDCFGLHFVRRNSIEVNGAVSSKIESFDPVTMRGITSSGRVYQLIQLGKPPAMPGDSVRFDRSSGY